MMLGDVLNIEKVFGLHRGDTRHYVERAGVDLKFVEAISREKHVAIFGCSKQDPLFETFKETHIRDFLVTLASLQRDANLPVILDYNRRQQKVRVTDKGFILWRKAQKKEDIKEMVFDTHYDN